MRALQPSSQPQRASAESRMTGACLRLRALAISAAADTSSSLPSGVSIGSLRSADKSAAVQTCAALLGLSALVPKRRDWRTKLVDNEAGEKRNGEQRLLHASKRASRCRVPAVKG